MKLFRKLNQLTDFKYERYLPTAFDNSLSLLEKIDKVIEFLNVVIETTNKIGEYVEEKTNEQDEKIRVLRNEFEELKHYMLNGGLEENVIHVLNEWLDNGKLAEIINNEVLDMKANQTDLDELDNRITSQLNKTNAYTTTNFNYLNNAKKSRKCVVSFIADDAPKDDLVKLLPIMQEKNIPIGIGVITSRVGKKVQTTQGEIDYMTWDEIKYMETQGAEIMSHTHEHRVSTQLTEQVLYDDIKKSKEILSSHGYLADGFVYPYNASSDITKKIVQQFYKYSFTGNGGRGNFADMSNNGITRVNLGAIGDPQEDGFPSDTLSLDYYKARVDWSIENDNWLVFVLHTGLSHWLPPIQQQNLRETIDYIKQKGIEIVSPREGFERYGNIMQIDEKTMIRADGEKLRDVTFCEKDKYSLDDPISKFPLYTVTYTPITKDLEGNPSNTSVLITYNLEIIDGRRYQRYTEVTFFGAEFIQKNMIRYWRNGEWSNWKRDEYLSINVDIASANNNLSNAPITEFPYQHITLNPIKSGIANSFPENKGGTLKTYNLSTEVHNQYQEYVVLTITGASDPSTANLTRKTYVRYWYNNKWTAWKLESETQ